MSVWFCFVLFLIVLQRCTSCDYSYQTEWYNYKSSSDSHSASLPPSLSLLVFFLPPFISCIFLFYFFSFIILLRSTNFDVFSAPFNFKYLNIPYDFFFDLLFSVCSVIFKYYEFSYIWKSNICTISVYVCMYSIYMCVCIYILTALWSEDTLHNFSHFKLLVVFHSPVKELSWWRYTWKKFGYGVVEWGVL